MTRIFAAFSAGVAGIALLAGPVVAQDTEVPASMIWTAYDLGSSGYAEASGMANGLQENFQTRVRIIPAGTSIGRLLPVTTGKADYGFLANEVFFAAEGLYDFAVPQWGPQDLRIVLGRPASNGMATAGDIGIETVADLKGKRICYVQGNPSVNVKTDATLAFAGLTRDDVKQVWLGSYSGCKDGIVSGSIDSFSSVTSSANVREIAASPRGIVWPPLPADDEEGWDRLHAIVDFPEPYEENVGPTLDENPKTLLGYRYPMMTAYASKGADEVYNIVAAIDASFDSFRNTTGSSENWDVKRSGLPRADAPFHEGTIRYMKEKGWWTDEAQAWNEQRMARLEKVMTAWEDAQAAFEGQGGDPEDADSWVPFWNEYRETNL